MPRPCLCRRRRRLVGLIVSSAAVAIAIAAIVVNVNPRAISQFKSLQWISTTKVM